jgi:hypothetical protein
MAREYKTTYGTYTTAAWGWWRDTAPFDVKVVPGPPHALRTTAELMDLLKIVEAEGVNALERNTIAKVDPTALLVLIEWLRTLLKGRPR